jgi:hypothetical protein
VDLADGEGIYVKLDRGHVVDFPHDEVGSILRILGNPTLIGIPNRFADQIGDGWKSLKEYAKERMDELVAKVDLQAIADYAILKEANAGTCVGRYSDALNLLTSSSFLSTIMDQECPLVRWLKKSADFIGKDEPFHHEWDTINKLAPYVPDLNTVPTLPQPNKEMAELKAECIQTYPMLFAAITEINKNRWSYIAGDLAFYVNHKNQALTPAAKSA